MDSKSGGESQAQNQNESVSTPLDLSRRSATMFILPMDLGETQEVPAAQTVSGTSHMNWSPVSTSDDDDADMIPQNFNQTSSISNTIVMMNDKQLNSEANNPVPLSSGMIVDNLDPCPPPLSDTNISSPTSVTTPPRKIFLTKRRSSDPPRKISSTMFVLKTSKAESRSGTKNFNDSSRSKSILNSKLTKIFSTGKSNSTEVPLSANSPNMFTLKKRTPATSSSSSDDDTSESGLSPSPSTLLKQGKTKPGDQSTTTVVEKNNSDSPSEMELEENKEEVYDSSYKTSMIYKAVFKFSNDLPDASTMASGLPLTEDFPVPPPENPKEIKELRDLLGKMLEDPYNNKRKKHGGDSSSSSSTSSSSTSSASSLDLHDVRGNEDLTRSKKGAHSPNPSKIGKSKGQKQFKISKSSKYILVHPTTKRILLPSPREFDNDPSTADKRLERFHKSCMSIKWGHDPSIVTNRKPKETKSLPTTHLKQISSKVIETDLRNILPPEIYLQLTPQHKREALKAILIKKDEGIKRDLDIIRKTKQQLMEHETSVNRLLTQRCKSLGIPLEKPSKSPIAKKAKHSTGIRNDGFLLAKSSPSSSTLSATMGSKTSTTSSMIDAAQRQQSSSKKLKGLRKNSSSGYFAGTSNNEIQKLHQQSLPSNNDKDDGEEDDEENRENIELNQKYVDLIKRRQELLSKSQKQKVRQIHKRRENQKNKYSIKVLKAPPTKFLSTSDDDDDDGGDGLDKEIRRKILDPDTQEFLQQLKHNYHINPGDCSLSEPNREEEVQVDTRPPIASNINEGLSSRSLRHGHTPKSKQHKSSSLKEELKRVDLEKKLSSLHIDSKKKLKHKEKQPQEEDPEALIKKKRDLEELKKAKKDQDEAETRKNYEAMKAAKKAEALHNLATRNNDKLTDAVLSDPRFVELTESLVTVRSTNPLDQPTPSLLSGKEEQVSRSKHLLEQDEGIDDDEMLDRRGEAWEELVDSEVEHELSKTKWSDDEDEPIVSDHKSQQD